MLDIKLIRKEPEKIEALVQRKEPGMTLSHVLDLDEQVRHIKSETEELKHLRNEHSKKNWRIDPKKRVGRISERRSTKDRRKNQQLGS